MPKPITFADGFDQPDAVAFGLPAPQLLIVVAFAVALCWVLHLGFTIALRLPMALSLAMCGAALGWGRWLERPLLEWAVAGGRYALVSKERTFVLMRADDAEADPELPPELADQPWARWLRRTPASTQEPATAVSGPAPAAAPIPASSGEAPHPAPAVAPFPAPIADAPFHAPGEAPHAQPVESPVLDGARRASRPPAPVEPMSPPMPDATRTTASTHVAPEAGAAVSLPLSVLGPHPDSADDCADETGLDEDAVILPFARALADEADDIGVDIEPGTGAVSADPLTPPAAGAAVFVGATRRVTFFSLNGGTGTTTLAAETAGLLAARGRHSRDGITHQRLKVALIDLDLRSATVAVRLGIPQPTIWDYVMDERASAENIDAYLVTHRSGLRALLGPPKPVARGRAIEPARIAEIVHQLESDGYHYIFFDIAADLDAITTWVLSAVHDVFVVLTPTASGVQDAYRTTEALRRLGLRHKLSYVVNRSRPGFDFREIMADLGGRVLAAIPYDPSIEEAENEHRLAALGSGPGAAALAGLAAHLYPPLQAAPPRRRLQLPWRRRAG